MGGRSGSCRTFIVPSAPQENNLHWASNIIWVTPWPICLKNELRACSPGKLCNGPVFGTDDNNQIYQKRQMLRTIIHVCKTDVSFIHTLMSPSAAPVANRSSFGPMDKHLTAEL